MKFLNIINFSFCKSIKTEHYEIHLKMAGPWWLIPVILATQEAEIRRIMVRSQLGQIVLRDPISKKPFAKKGGWSSLRCRP
jgi:hypothetical protein